MLIEAGLRILVDDKEPYDRFRGRLMLPIEDARGRVIAFGGRILEAGKTDAPKYLNSPDTPLFDKGRTLYNLHRAGPLSRQTGRLVVVEGYMDVIALSAAGIGDCVAPLGTALTERQIELLWRLVEAPVLCFDGDAAGQRAAMRAVTRALPMLRPAHTLRICQLPAGLDPDDLVKRDGQAAMEERLAGAQSLIETLWQYELAAAPLTTPEEKAGLKARLMAHVDTISDDDIKSLYRRELSDRFSAFAFPRREFTPREFTPRASTPRARGRFQHTEATPIPSADTAQRLNHATGKGGRDGLTSAVLAGFVRYPAEIVRHADALAGVTVGSAALGRLLDALLDANDSGQALETETLATTLASEGIHVPGPEDYAKINFPFLRTGVDRSIAVEALDAAVAVLVEGPALDAAIEAATERFDIDEQTRLRKRKQDLDDRLKARLRD
jgi:DNA primase